MPLLLEDLWQQFRLLQSQVIAQPVLPPPVDGGGTTPPTTTGDIWYAENYGVTAGNGLDQSAALNATIALASTNNIGWLYLPPGVISIAAPIVGQSGVIIVGAGKLDSALSLLDGSNCDIYQIADGARHGGLRNLLLRGNRYGQTPGDWHHGINTSTSGSVFDPAFSFTDVEIDAVSGNGTMGTPDDNHFTYAGHFFSNCYVHDCGGYAFVPRWDTSFANCNAFGAGLSGFYLANPSNSITGTKSYNNGRAPVWDGTAATYAGGTVYHIGNGVKDVDGNVWVSTNEHAAGQGIPGTNTAGWTKLLWGPWEGGHPIWSGFVYSVDGHYYSLLTATVTGAFGATGGAVGTNVVQLSGIGGTIVGFNDPLSHGYGFHLRGVSTAIPADGGGKECTLAACDGQQNSGGGFYFENCAGSTVQGVAQQANCDPWNGFNRLKNPFALGAVGMAGCQGMTISVATSHLNAGSDRSGHLADGVTTALFTADAASVCYFNTDNPAMLNNLDLSGDGSGNEPTHATVGTGNSVRYNGAIKGVADTIESYVSIVTAAGTTALNAFSSATQVFLTGSTTQTIQLPDTTNMVIGKHFTFTNKSSGLVTIKVFNASLGTGAKVVGLAGGMSMQLICIGTGANTPAEWDVAPDLGVFNVMKFGAVGDATADDSTACQAAITAASNRGGGIVYFPPGNYRLTAAGLTVSHANVILKGSGETSTTLTVANAAAFSAIKFSNSGTTVNYFGVRDMTLVKEGNPGDNVAAIWLQDILFPRLEHVQCNGFGTSIHCQNTIDLHMNEVYLACHAATVTNAYGVYMDCTTGNFSAYMNHVNVDFSGTAATTTTYGYYSFGAECSDWFCHFCEAGNGATYGWYYDATAAAAAPQVFDLHFVNCVADQCQVGFTFKNTENFPETGGQIDLDSCNYAARYLTPTANAAGVDLDAASGVTIRGCQFFAGNPARQVAHPTEFSNCYGVYAHNGTRDCSISNNTFKGKFVQNLYLNTAEFVTITGNNILASWPNTPTSSTNGILLDASFGISIVGNTIRGIDGVDKMVAGIWVVHTSHDVTIDANIVDATTTVANGLHLDMTSGGPVNVITANNVGIDNADNVQSIIFNVKDYGAVGDGTPGDDIGFQAAIDAAAAVLAGAPTLDSGGVNSGGEIYVPPGTYNFTGPIVISTSGIRIQGANAQTCVIKVAHNPSFIPVTFTDTGSLFVRSCGISGITIQQGDLTGGSGASSTNTKPGIYVFGTVFTEISEVNIYEFQTCVHAVRTNNLRGEHVYCAGDLVTTTNWYGWRFDSTAEGGATDSNHNWQNASVNLTACNVIGNLSINSVGYFHGGDNPFDIYMRFCEGDVCAKGLEYDGSAAGTTTSTAFGSGLGAPRCDDVHIIQFVADSCLIGAHIHDTAVTGAMINLDNFFFGYNSAGATDNIYGVLVENANGVHVRGAQMHSKSTGSVGNYAVLFSGSYDCSVSDTVTIGSWIQHIYFFNSAYCSARGNSLTATDAGAVNATGILASGGGLHSIVSNTVHGVWDGVHTTGSTNTGLNFQQGIYCLNTAHVTIGHNVVDVRTIISPYLESGSTNIVRRSNIGFTDSAGNGAFLLDGTDNVVTSSTGVPLVSYNDDTGAQPFLTLARARGSQGSPAAIQSGDILGSYYFAAQYDTTTDHYYIGSGMLAFASQNQTATHGGQGLRFYVTPNNSITPVAALVLDQNSKLYTPGPLSDLNGNPFISISPTPWTSGPGVNRLNIIDAAGNIITAFDQAPTATAPNFLAIGNVGAGGLVALSATSMTEVNVGMNLVTTGSGTVNINGTPVAVLASPAFTGTPTAPTAAGGTNTTQIATTAFVTAAVSAGTIHLDDTQNVLTGTARYFPLISYSASVAPSLILERSLGTSGSPTALTGGESLGGIFFTGQYDTTVGHQIGGAGMFGAAAQAFTAAHAGTDLSFWTIPLNSITPTLTLTLSHDQTATFAGVVSGVTPTSSAHLATKGYVDSLVGGAGSFTTLTATGLVTFGSTGQLTVSTAGTVSTSGNLTTTGSGTITSAGLLTGSAGLTVTGTSNLGLLNTLQLVATPTTSGGNAFNIFAGVAGIPGFLTQRINGTAGSPTAIANGDQLARWYFEGQYDTTVGHLAAGALIQSVATETWTGATVHGADLEFYTTKNTSGSAFDQTLALTLGQDQSATFAGLVTASAAGINLGNTTLTVYREGTFTPGFQGSTGSIGTAAVSTPNGYYTRVGNLVFLTMLFTITNKGSWTGNLVITGLPYTVQNVTNNQPMFTAQFANGAGGLAAVSVAAYGIVNTKTAGMLDRSAAAVAESSITIANVATSCTVVVSGCYQTADAA